MNRWVSTSEKSGFLHWFLKNHRLKRKDSRLILDYLINHPHILEHVTFTDTVSPQAKTIIISSMQSDEQGFVYYNQSVKSEDPSKVLGDLMAHPSAKRNLIIHFYGSHIHATYQQLLQTPIKEQYQNYKRFKRYEDETKVLLDQVKQTTDRNTLLAEIDAALDDRNEALFKELTIRLRELDESIP
ncbi:IDEAL domain-containing protein [Alkalicoccobacillus porphyridii]|uniref:IDEAL domain-containing protein n=2 Tax=Alkalicoccobacillus porphyridii TaxID=2597270 RepID=A0A554A0M6_9BACI|nr:IDEAL domain-containing protein [Alkalicoccobacillus porphyridii]